jgi:glucose dehydrogenase
MADDTLYVITSFNRIIALDPETGTQKWAFDPKIDRVGDYGDALASRGAGAACRSQTPIGPAMPQDAL